MIANETMFNQRQNEVDVKNFKTPYKRGERYQRAMQTQRSKIN